VIVALVPDLMDRSKVSAAAKAAGESVRFVNQAPRLVAAVEEDSPDLVLVDLGRPGAVDAVRELAGAGAGAGARVVGFGSHVDRDLLAEAGDAGCEEVLARSQFFRDLARVLTERPEAEPPA